MEYTFFTSISLDQCAQLLPKCLQVFNRFAAQSSDFKLHDLRIQHRCLTLELVAALNKFLDANLL